MRTKYTTSWIAVIILIICTATGISDKKPSLKDVFGDLFYIGTAVNVKQACGKDKAGEQIVKHHFNSVVAENCMKSVKLQPSEGVFTFEDADRFVAFGEENDMLIIGHALIWHSQLPQWFCVDENGNNASPELLTERMRSHIHTVVGRYKGRVHGWDVVNEAILDDGSWRNSKFYEILGEEFVALAFRFAHEADPDAELYYNDYSMANPGRREGVVRLARSLKEQGLRIDGIGMQGHIGMEYPSIDEFEKSIVAFANEGMKVMVTELDLTVLPMPRPDIGADVAASFEYQQEMNPYADGLPDDVSQAWNARMQQFFELFAKHRDKISRVTLWGVSDGDSWRNDWPVRGRTDYPLLFDRNHNPKPVVNELINNLKKKIT